MASDSVANYAALVDEDQELGKSSMATTIANVVKAILGAGILTLSWAFYFSSLWPGVVITIVMGLLSIYTFQIIGVCSEVTRQSSYGAIWRETYGARWAWIPDVVTLIFTAIAIVSYLIIIGDYVPIGLRGLGVTWDPLSHRFWPILFAAAIVSPLGFLNDVSFLGYTSVVGLLGCFYTTLMLAGEVGEIGADGDWEPLTIQPGMFVTMPTVAFAFNGHFSAPSMYQQLKGRTPARWLIVNLVAFGVCIPITLVCGVTGYLMFGKSLSMPGRTNVLAQPELGARPEVMLAYIATTLSVWLSIPIYVHNTRDAAANIWARDIAPLFKCVSDDPSVQRKYFTAATLFVTLGAAIAVTDLGLAVALAGALTACLLMYVFPVLMYFKCSTYKPNGGYGGWILHRGLPALALVVGVVMAVAGVTTTLMLSAGMVSDLRW